MQPLDDDAIGDALTALPRWTLADDGLRIGRELHFSDFPTAFAFMTAVAIEAQVLDHHPDWSNSYAGVTISLTTHAAGGLTHRDFALAVKIDGHASAAVDGPPKDGCGA